MHTPRLKVRKLREPSEYARVVADSKNEVHVFTTDNTHTHTHTHTYSQTMSCGVMSLWGNGVRTEWSYGVALVG